MQHYAALAQRGRGSIIQITALVAAWLWAGRSSPWPAGQSLHSQTAGQGGPGRGGAGGGRGSVVRG